MWLKMLNGRRSSLVTQEQLTAAVESARREGDMSATLASHLAECRNEKSEIWKRLDRQDEESDKRHKENLDKFDKLFRMAWLGMGALGVLQWILTHHPF